MKRKIMAILLACALAIGTVASPARMESVRAKELQTADGIQYTIDGDGITVTGYDGTAEELVIPADIGGVKVTGIQAYAFDGCGGLRGIKLPEGLKRIGYWAFRDCSSLTRMNIPESVTDIGTGAFSSTPWLAGQCSENGGLAIINHILVAADEGISGSVTIPDGVTSIGYGAFNGCSDLTGIKIPKGVTSIRSSAFHSCSGLAEIQLPAGLASIGDAVFYDCISLTSIEVPEGVVSIGMGAFSGCTSLESISIPESATDIGGSDRDIISPWMGSSTRLCNDTPWQKKQLEENGGLAILNHVLVAVEAQSFDIEIPEGVTCIDGEAFSQYRYSGGSLKLPESMTNIGAVDFLGKFDEIFVDQDNPNYMTVDGALYDQRTKELLYCRLHDKEISIWDGTISIGNSVFSDSWLKAIELPAELTSIGDSAFRGCSILTGIELPAELTSIGDSAFRGCSRLTSIAIPSGVTSIGSFAFTDCSGLTGIELPAGLTSIADYAFFSCSWLTDIAIPSGVTSIGKFSFDGCSGLASVTIPTSVTVIASWAFRGCEQLKDVYYAGSEEQWKKISVGNDNDVLASANIHYGSSNSSGTGGSGSVTPTKSAQIITANNLTKTYGEKAFFLGAASTGDGELSYASSDTKVATVDLSGKVTVKGCGVANITVTAKETAKYHAAAKTVTLTVKPKKISLSSAKSKKKKTAAIKWKRGKEASGYIIQCSTDKKFKKNKKQVTIEKNKTTSTTMKKLKGGKTYYVRVCAYAKAGKSKIQGDWSKAKTVKIKK